MFISPHAQSSIRTYTHPCVRVDSLAPPTHTHTHRQILTHVYISRRPSRRSRGSGRVNDGVVTLAAGFALRDAGTNYRHESALFRAQIPLCVCPFIDWTKSAFLRREICQLGRTISNEVSLMKV